MLTGEYAFRQKGTGILPGDAKLIIEPGRPTLASMLKSAGYKTGVVGKWHLGLGAGVIDWNGEIKPGPNEIGFDESFIMAATGDRVPCVYVRNHRIENLDPADPIQVSYQNPFPGEADGVRDRASLKMDWSHGHNQAVVNGVGRIGYMSGGRKARWTDETMAETFAKEAVAFIGRSKDQPFFLYFATHDVHVPRIVNPRFAGKTTMGPRGDAIAEFDWQVGQVLDAIERHDDDEQPADHLRRRRAARGRAGRPLGAAKEVSLGVPFQSVPSWRSARRSRRCCKARRRRCSITASQPWAPATMA